MTDAECSSIKSCNKRRVRGRRNTGSSGGEEEESDGGALAVAMLCNKALFPNRVLITIALTPLVARFLVRRQIIKKNA
ncbi:hypothetical protein RHMOL_Rhmol11G0170700 [Rhododendron molle]|uniref:Uncharacterized protein n=1 Tax=Rhododendron molle TaxID=49168 RepID=A0ACC0LTD9_RHOML|nr:hypothetical protein RHMOL_Rhmol11G0170700 [Rhododendron molle]